jgi:hypothetical protein
MPGTLVGLVVALGVLVSPVDAQMAHGLKGALRATGGAPIANASIRADNIDGFRGEQFTGAKQHTTTTAASGEWNITGIESGLWVFSSSAPDTIPAVMMLGAGGTALLARDWEGAGKIIWDARGLVPKEQRPALAAAIDDLRAIMRVQ